MRAAGVFPKPGVWKDYLSLTKPCTVLLHLLTAASAMFLAAKGVPQGNVLLFTLLGGGLTAAASNALNCYFDRTIDGIMARTRQRPLPAGRLNPNHALLFSITSGFTGLLILSLSVSLAAAGLAAGALVYYVAVYTLWSKRRTRWSTVIGSGVGAFPPLIGWMAVTGRIELTPFLLFATIAFWTPPHFWALALLRRNDYEAAKIPVLPARNRTHWIFLFTLLMVSMTLFLPLLTSMGTVYYITALLLGFGYLALSASLIIWENRRIVRLLYYYSLAYLVTLFGLILFASLFI